MAQHEVQNISHPAHTNKSNKSHGITITTGVINTQEDCLVALVPVEEQPRSLSLCRGTSAEPQNIWIFGLSLWLQSKRLSLSLMGTGRGQGRDGDKDGDGIYLATTLKILPFHIYIKISDIFFWFSKKLNEEPCWGQSRDASSPPAETSPPPQQRGPLKETSQSNEKLLFGFTSSSIFQAPS